LVVTEENAVDAPPDRQVELAEMAVAQRAGPGALRRPRAAGELDDAHDATPARTKSCSGTGTAANTRSSTESGVTSSAIASYESTSRWRNTSFMSSCMSAATTYWRPRSSASARD